MTVVEPRDAPRGETGCCARYRIGSGTGWTECRLLDISLTGALVELSGDVPDGPIDDLPFLLEFDTIADDDVAITISAALLEIDRTDARRPVGSIEFRAGRRERILLHLLVRLHSLV